MTAFSHHGLLPPTSLLGFGRWQGVLRQWWQAVRLRLARGTSQPFADMAPTEGEEDSHLWAEGPLPADLAVYLSHRTRGREARAATSGLRLAAAGLVKTRRRDTVGHGGDNGYQR